MCLGWLVLAAIAAAIWFPGIMIWTWAAEKGTKVTMNDSDKKAVQVFLVIGAIILIAVVTPALSDGGRSSAGSIPFVIAIILLIVACSLPSRSETSDGGFDAGTSVGDYVDDVDDDVDDDASLGVSDGVRIRREAAEERREELEELAELRKEVAELRRKEGERKPSEPTPSEPEATCPDVLSGKAPRPVTPATPKVVKAGELFTNSIGMKLAMIPAGEFMMGDYGKQHRVRITQPFSLSIYPVTQEQYERVMGRNPSDFKGGSNFPVEKVLWEDAREFCDKLSALPQEQSAGRTYRLPTEAEWEYACRAGSVTRYCFGDSAEWLLWDYAWFTENSDDTTHPVGEMKPNSWGLYDMHGNVEELCQDSWDPDYYENSPVDNPAGPSTSGCRMTRGGSWINHPVHCRSAYRNGDEPDLRLSTLGFRVALDPAE